MKRLSIKGLSKGFTLIELLVVIAILGVLAAAILAAIDPLEQIRKSQDSSAKDTSVEFASAVARFYATRNANPWDTAANGGDAACNGAVGATPNMIALSAMGACINALVAQGEIKSAFAALPATTLQKIFVKSPNPNVAGANTDTETCFKPLSKSQQVDPNSKYVAATGANTCVPAVGSACYWCTQ